MVSFPQVSPAKPCTYHASSPKVPHATDSTDKDNILNSYYASVFSCDRNIPNTQSAHLGETFIINIKLIRRRVAAIRTSKSTGPESIPGEILKLDGEAMIPFLDRLLEITLNNATIKSG
jgi:hypothetical protein